MSTNTPSSETIKPKMNPFLRALLGLLLLLPACGLCFSNVFLLSLSTMQGSFRKGSLQGAGEFIGMLNYQQLFENPIFASSIGFTALLIVIRLLAVGILPLLLALAVNTFGKKLKLSLRLLFTLPLAYFGPALVMFGPAYMRELWRSESLEGTVLFIDGMASLAVACGIGLIVYSAVLRGQSRKPLIIAWLVAGLATIAFALQTFTNFTALLPNRGSTPLGYYLYLTLRNAQGGLTYAASFIILILVGILGIVATLLIIFSRVQLKHEPNDEAATLPTKSRFAILGWVAIILGGIAAISVTLIPLFMSVIKTLTSSGSSAVDFLSILRIWGTSLLPPMLVILLVQLPVAYLGGLGIGIVRPFGKFSQWLLLLFSPWLFVTSVPLAFATLESFREMKIVDSPITLIQPILLSVPMLLILTLFFSGQQPKWQKAREDGTPAMSAFFKHLIIPSFPLALLMAALALLAATQDLFMPLLAGFNPEQLTATTAILRLSGGTDSSAASSIIALFGLPIFILFFILFAALQVFQLNRLVLVSESKTTENP